MKKIVIALTAFGLVASPIAASAGTRASDVVPAAAEIDRVSPTADKKAKDVMGGSGLIIGLIAAAAVIAGIVVIADDDDAVSNG